MPENQEAFEMLVLQEIAGVISDEDRVQMLEIVDRDPDAREIRARLHAEYPEAFVQALDEELEEKLAVPAIKEELKQRKMMRRLNWGGAVLLFWVVFIGAYLLFERHTEEERLLNKGYSFNQLRDILIILPDGRKINLSDAEQVKSAEDLGLVYKPGYLSWKGGRHIYLMKIVVPRTQRLMVQLKDGTEVRLNSASVLETPMQFEGASREVSVEGEAFFDVVGDAKRPFIVHVPHLTVKVLGTAFNVNTYDTNRVDVMLKSGKVKLFSANDSLTMVPGQFVSFQQGVKMAAEEMDSANLLWREGRYDINFAYIKNLLPLFERVYGKRFLLEDKALGDLLVLGTLETNKPVDSLLKETFKVKYVGDSVVIIGKEGGK